MSYSIKRDIIQEAKYAFLRFLQGYFSNEVRYKWTADIRTTNIIIVDKNTLDLGTALTRPAIVLNRNGAGWSYVSGNQNAINTTGEISTLLGNAPSARPGMDITYSDLLTGTMSFTILFKNGIAAEKLASLVFTLLTGHKAALRAAGIHKLTNLSIGPEQLIKQNAEHELIGITINFTYYIQATISKMPTLSNTIIFIGDEEVFEGFDYTVALTGDLITFLGSAPESLPTISYIDAVTLEEHSDVALVSTDDPLVYYVPDGGKILGFYKVLDSIILDVEVP